MSKTEERLRGSGLKFTKQRQAILEILENAEQPLSAEQIYRDLAETKEVPASLSTVYRALDQMAGKNIVTKISLTGDGKALFELDCSLHRHYLYCLECGRILTIRSCPLGNYEETLTAETGFEIVGHKLNVYGYCPECRKKAQK